MIKKLVLLVLIFGMLCIATLFYAKHTLEQPINIQSPEIITITPGTNVSSFTRTLVEKDWIATRFWIKQYVRFVPQLSKIKAGTYKIEVGTSLLDLIQQIVKGQEHYYSITFIEGTTLKEWLITINQHEQFADKPPLKTDSTAIEKIADMLGLSQKNPEGLFFPDTYTFTENTSAIELLKRAQLKMQQHLAQLWETRDKNIPYKTSYQALIMASIVEKESGQVSEQPTISSVFVNRLAKKMRLQTDPTVIYGLGERYKGDITYKHLREKTAYNTYRINGLPPTPIAMPGMSALKAVMHPETTDYLYFVSRGNGYHKFSKSLKEHNKAVRKYILKKG